MAKEYIELEPGNEYGVISLNKTVFSTIAKNVIEEDEKIVMYGIAIESALVNFKCLKKSRQIL